VLQVTGSAVRLPPTPALVLPTGLDRRAAAVEELSPGTPMTPVTVRVTAEADGAGVVGEDAGEVDGCSGRGPKQWDESFPVKQLAIEMDGFDATLNATAGSTPRPSAEAAAAAKAEAEAEEAEAEAEAGGEQDTVEGEEQQPSEVEAGGGGGRSGAKFPSAQFPSPAVRCRARVDEVVGATAALGENAASHVQLPSHQHVQAHWALNDPHAHLLGAAAETATAASAVRGILKRASDVSPEGGGKRRKVTFQVRQGGGEPRPTFQLPPVQAAPAAVEEVVDGEREMEADADATTTTAAAAAVSGGQVRGILLPPCHGAT
jgi:hypothetical protein